MVITLYAYIQHFRIEQSFSKLSRILIQDPIYLLIFRGQKFECAKFCNFWYLENLIIEEMFS